MLLSGSSSKLQAFRNRLNHSAASFCMSFATSKCEIFLEDWTGWPLKFFSTREELDEVDNIWLLRYLYPI